MVSDTIMFTFVLAICMLTFWALVQDDDDFFM